MNMPTRPDEIALWNTMRNGTTMRDAAQQLGIPPRRTLYLANKWSERGWYDWGVAHDLGWITGAGPAPTQDAPSPALAESSRGLGWWAISGEELLDALKRAHAGENPDILYAELYANSDVEDVAAEDGNADQT